MSYRLGGLASGRATPRAVTLHLGGSGLGTHPSLLFIAQVLGIPPEERHEIVELGDRMAAAFGLFPGALKLDGSPDLVCGDASRPVASSSEPVRVPGVGYGYVSDFGFGCPAATPWPAQAAPGACACLTA